MWLMDRVDGTVYFPEESGTFPLQGIERYTTLIVEGPEAQEARSPITLASTSSASTSSASDRPKFKSVITPKKGTTHGIKVRIMVLLVSVTVKDSRTRYMYSASSLESKTCLVYELG